MIVYVNGDSHSAGAEAINKFCFADDDPRYTHLGRKAHPDNAAVSYGAKVATHFGTELMLDAESGSSNDRIIRTTKEYLKNNKPNIVIIGWATWEREEWLHNETYYQVSGGGFDSVPKELHTKYKEWVIEKSKTYAQDEIQSHQKIWNFHQELLELQIPHLFFNTYMHFGHMALNDKTLNWSNNYVRPYEQSGTYYYWLHSKGFRCVQYHDVHESYHYGANGQEAWASYLIPYVQGLIR